jgi:excisionase family DNA binding protein
LAKPTAIKWSKQAQEQIVLHTVPGAAEFLGCSDMHVYRLIAAGQLRAVDISSAGARRTKTRIRSDDLAAYIERRTRGA